MYEPTSLLTSALGSINVLEASPSREEKPRPPRARQSQYVRNNFFDLSEEPKQKYANQAPAVQENDLGLVTGLQGFTSEPVQFFENVQAIISPQPEIQPNKHDTEYEELGSSFAQQIDQAPDFVESTKFKAPVSHNRYSRPGPQYMMEIEDDLEDLEEIKDVPTLQLEKA